MKVPLLDLTRIYRKLEPEITAAVEDLLHSQQMILGPAVDRFEQSLAALCGSLFAVGCASGSDALYLALLAVGVGPDDEVITTPFTFFASAGSIVRTGARPVFVDIDPLTFNLDAGKIDSVLSENTKAILPVHLYGQSADMGPILEIARRDKLSVIEDAAQAIGARWHDRVVGTMGIIGCLSFYPTKNLGAAGDAGACLTDDEALSEELRSLRVHGSVPGDPYRYRRVGINSRLDAVQAVILSVKMKHLREWNETRRALAADYTARLKDIDEVAPPHVAQGCEHVFHQYVIRVRRRDELQAFLEGCGVQTRVFYPRPLHLEEAFRSLGHREGDFPEAERAGCEVLSLPLYPGLTAEEQAHVTTSIRRFYAGGRSKVRVSSSDAEE